MRYLFILAVIFSLWCLGSLSFGHQLIPTPWETINTTIHLLMEISCWQNLSITLFRGITGLLLVFAVAFIVGIPCGLSRRVMELLSPIVVASQSCPPIVWISLLLVWLGMGTAVPVIVIFVTTFPMAFFNIAQGVASLDRRLFVMAKVYKASKWMMLKDIILPGISPYIVASFSSALSTCWKVTATAEFLGSANGIGSQVYWAYHFLNMPLLFSWALILILLGTALEMWVVHPLRQRYRQIGTERQNG